MCKASHIAALLGLSLSIFPIHRLSAQQSNLNSVVYEAARNKIGLLRYCLNNTTLDSETAEKAVEVIETGLRAFPLDEQTRELGDRAERAGEDGFLDAVRRKDIASFAQRFGTSSTGLCKQWAEEALPARKAKASGPVVSIATIQPIPSRPRAAPPAVNVSHRIEAPYAAERPPVPAKPVLRPTEAGLALQQSPVSSAAPAPQHIVEFCPPPD
jgi:hypothetical protein